MLKTIMIAGLLISASPVPLTTPLSAAMAEASQDAQLARRLKDLEIKVQRMERENNEMERELKFLKNLLFTKFNIDINTYTPDVPSSKFDCETNLNAEKAKLNEMKANGLKPKHPFMIRTKAKLKRLEEKCGAKE